MDLNFVRSVSLRWLAPVFITFQDFYFDRLPLPRFISRYNDDPKKVENLI